MRKPGVVATPRLTRQQSADIATVLNGYIAGLAWMLEPGLMMEPEMIAHRLESSAALARIIRPMLPGGVEVEPQARPAAASLSLAPPELEAA